METPFVRYVQHCGPTLLSFLFLFLLLLLLLPFNTQDEASWNCVLCVSVCFSSSFRVHIPGQKKSLLCRETQVIFPGQNSLSISRGGE